jgi:bifunctional DNase/RNase
MPQMSICKIQYRTFGLNATTTFQLLDEQQHLLLLQFNESAFPVSISTVTAQDAIPAEPLTNDFLASVLHALGGTLEEIAIDALPGGQLYARVHLHDQGRLHIINASLKDALHLAHREQSRISVSDAILARKALSLPDYGATVQESLSTIERLAEIDPNSLYRVAQQPRNLDFCDGLRGWIFSRSPDDASHCLDPHTTLTGKPSLAITLHKPFTDPYISLLDHERFHAGHYRGQRVRLSAYVKTEHIHPPALELAISWPLDTINPFTGFADYASHSTHSHIIPHTADAFWSLHELVIDVPEQARDIIFSLNTQEQGKLWLDGIQFTAVDHSVPLTGTILSPPLLLPLNLDFSNSLEYWSIEGSSPWDYERGVEATATPSAFLKSMVTAPIGSCILQQMLDLENYQGQSVRLTARLKTLDVASRASLFIGSDTVIMGIDRIEKVITGTTSWSAYTLDCRVPPEDMGVLFFGVSLQGPGQIWLQDVHLQTVKVS